MDVYHTNMPTVLAETFSHTDYSVEKSLKELDRKTEQWISGFTYISIVEIRHKLEADGPKTKVVRTIKYIVRNYPMPACQ